MLWILQGHLFCIGSYEAPAPLRLHQHTSREPVRNGIAIKNSAGVRHSEQITR